MSVLFLTTFILYLNFPTQAFDYDSYNYALCVEKRPLYEYQIFNPHHLLPIRWIAYFYEGLKSIGYQGRALPVHQVFNSFFGALGVILLFSTAYFCTQKIIVALGASIILASCYQYWYISTFGGFYVLVAFSLLLLYKVVCTDIVNSQPILGSRWISFATGPTKTILSKDILKRYFWFAIIGFLQALTILVHQTNVLASFFVGTSLFFRKDPWDQRIIGIIIAIFFSILTIVPPYFYVGYSKQEKRNPKSFSRWFTTYAHVQKWGVWRPTNITDASKEVFYVWFGPLSRSGPQLSLKDATVQKHFLKYLGLALLLYPIIAGFGFFFRYGVFWLLSWIWLLPFAIFFTAWEPGTGAFWASTLPPTVLLICLSISDISDKFYKLPYRKPLQYLISVSWLCLSVYFAWINWQTNIFPESHGGKTIPTAESQAIMNITRQGDAILFMGRSIDEQRIEAEFPNLHFISFYDELAWAFGSQQKAQNKISNQIQQFKKQGHRIFINNGIIQGSRWNLIMMDFPNVSNELLKNFLSNYQSKQLKDTNVFQEIQ
ncbi:MAG: hypothetical protein PHE88_09935 [Elusimicrobia bacterium]|nr:hypothetical protein [Elusimicrobiota bacterium]